MFSNFKKRLGVLTAIAVMAALVPALAASPASAAVALTPVAPDSGALHSACPAGSAAAAGFTDTHRLMSTASRCMASPLV